MKRSSWGVALFNLALMVSSTVWAQARPTLQLGVEVNDHDEYRLTVTERGFPRGISYSTSIAAALSTPPGVARGVSIRVRSKLVGLMGDCIDISNGGYSSASQIALDEIVFDAFPGKQPEVQDTKGILLVSGWYKVENLLRGYERCFADKNPANWIDYMLEFQMGLPQMSLSIDSGWHRFDRKTLKALKRQALPRPPLSQAEDIRLAYLFIRYEGPQDHIMPSVLITADRKIAAPLRLGAASTADDFELWFAMGFARRHLVDEKDFRKLASWFEEELTRQKQTGPRAGSSEGSGGYVVSARNKAHQVTDFGVTMNQQDSLAFLRSFSAHVLLQEIPERKIPDDPFPTSLLDDIGVLIREIEY